MVERDTVVVGPANSRHGPDPTVRQSTPETLVAGFEVTIAAT